MGLKSWFTTGEWNGERSTSPNDDWLAGKWDDFVTGRGKSGKTISKQNALTISGVYAAVKVYSDAISSLPVHIMRETGSTKEKYKKHPVYPLLSREPNKLMTVNTFWQIVVPELLLWGNSFSIIEFHKGSFRPKSLLPVHPSKVEVDIIEGVLVYTIKMENSDDIILDQSNVLHFRGQGDTVIGKSVIDCAKENLELGAAAEEFGNRFFGNGASMSGVLQTDEKLSDKAFNNLKNSFNDSNGGLANASKPLILEEGLKYQPISIPPDNAQFLETRRFNIEDVARWFNLPPDKLKDLSRATFSNLEQQDLNFVRHSLMPYVISIEQELTRKLLRETEKRSVWFEMNLDGLLRGDIKTRTESYRTLFNIGAMSANEIRARENMNPFEGGDARYVPMNLGKVDEEGNNQPQTEAIEPDENQLT
jgi:HK97 family phage portal protein